MINRSQLDDAFKADLALRMVAMSNRELVSAAFDAAYPDDFNGDFTPRGQYENDTLRIELIRRMAEHGFLSIPHP